MMTLPADLQSSEVTQAGSGNTVPDLSRVTHDLSVVVPAYNEEQRLPRTLRDLKAFLDEWGVDYRVLVVNDGSADRTAELAAAFGSRFSTLNMPCQSGKGAAVRAGMLAATGNVVAFTDADLPYDLAALRAGYAWVQRGGCDVVFGARDLEESQHSVPRKLSRSIATTVFRGVVSTLVSRQVTDTQCGLKIFSRRGAQAIFARTRIDGFAFDAEVVYLTHFLQLPFRRVAVTLINEYASTLSLSRHALPMFMDVLRLRVRAWRGEYRAAATLDVTGEQPLRKSA